MVLKILCPATLVLVASCIPAHAQDQQRRRQPGWPCVGKVDPLYVRGAEATGGNVLLLGRGEMGGAAVQMGAADRHDEVVLRAGGELAEGVYEYEVPLDSTIESAYFHQIGRA